jgi:hypothetical protein
MKRLSTLLLSLLMLSACGTPPTSSSAALGNDEPLATITGQTLETVWHCGGARLPDQPPQGPCSTLEPFATTFAVAQPVEGAPGTFTLVTYVTSDAAGHFSVKVPAGSYVLVTKYAITHDPADDTYAFGMVDPFTVAAGQTVTKAYEFMTPAPPISIGVGN